MNLSPEAIPSVDTLNKLSPIKQKITVTTTLHFCRVSVDQFLVFYVLSRYVVFFVVAAILIETLGNTKD